MKQNETASVRKGDAESHNQTNTYYSEESEEEEGKSPEAAKLPAQAEAEKVDFVKETFAKFGLNMNLYNPGIP
jgi:hypothetical protein